MKTAELIINGNINLDMNKEWWKYQYGYEQGVELYRIHYARK